MSLEGLIEDSKGRPFTGSWTLALTNGRDPESVVSFASGSDRFTLDLVPGRWRLRPESSGLAGKTLQIDVSADPDEPQRVQFRMLPAGLLTGTVLTWELEPLEGFPVLLESLDDERLTSAATAPDGSFAFSSVLDGDHRIHYGSREYPAFPPQVVRFIGPRHRLAPLQAPRFVEIMIRVVSAGELVADACIEGVGQRGGSLAGTTDSEGVYRARFLPLGNYRVVASHISLGRCEARIPVEIDSPGQIELQLRN